MAKQPFHGGEVEKLHSLSTPHPTAATASQADPPAADSGHIQVACMARCSNADRMITCTMEGAFGASPASAESLLCRQIATGR